LRFKGEEKKKKKGKESFLTFSTPGVQSKPRWKGGEKGEGKRGGKKKKKKKQRYPTIYPSVPMRSLPVPAQEVGEEKEKRGGGGKKEGKKGEGGGSI